MPQAHGLLSTAWGTLRRFLGIKAVEQPDTFMSVERRDSLGSFSSKSDEQRDVVQPDSFCTGCQELRDDLPKQNGRRQFGELGFLKSTEIWNMRPMKSKDSCRGCALIVEGVKKLGYDEYGYTDLRVDYYASRLSVSYMDATYVFAGREGTENPWGLRPSQRPSFHSTNSKKSIELASEWVRDCAAHETCQDVTDGRLPTRILDIGSVATDKIVLRETGFERGRYSCLSYCWGNQPFIRTLKKNINDHKIGIAWEKLPPTFQHTIEIVRHLGIRYLWIDALCIVQDDHRDWERESGKMATIYHNSFITISATAATSPHAGLFCTATAVDLGSVSVQLIHHFPNDMKDQRAHRFPVLSRAWTYQERMLAPRVLHFGPEEIFWECYERRCCECAPKQYAFRDEVSKSDFFGRLVAPVSDPDGYNAPQNVWRKIVVAYSPLALTVSSDKLPALSGLAEERRVFTNQKYLAGLWEHTLVLDLLWYRSDGYGDELTPVPIELASRAPSWSWASVDGAIMYEQYLYCSGNRMPGSTIFCDILQAECITRSQSTTGTETSGFITLKCSTLPVSFRDGRLRLNNNKSSLEFWSDNRADLEHEVLHVLRLAQLDIYNNGEYMLVVKPSGPHQKTFVRVGLASLSHGKYSNNTDEVQWPEKTEITIF